MVKRGSEEFEKLLVENFISLQKVLTDLTSKFDGLTKQISELLTLFEKSAKDITENQGERLTKEDKRFMDKLDSLIEQNKTIARGLTLLEEKIRKTENRENKITSRPKPLPEF
jgi:hypothetical protein